jgi:hypothetical protein
MATEDIQKDRRAVLAAIAGLGAGAAGLSLNGCTGGGPLLVGGVMLGRERYGVAAVNPRGTTRWVFDTPGRVHDVALAPDGVTGVVIARRPGRFLQYFEVQTGRVLQTVAAPAGTWFEGHACFVGDHLWVAAARTGDGPGRTGRGGNGGGHAAAGLLALRWQPRADRADGWLALPDRTGLHQIRHTPLPGGDSRVLAAVGGWRVSGRRVLNPRNFDSALVVLDADGAPHLTIDAPRDPGTGLPLSLRHFDVAADGSVWAGLQYPDPAPADAPLLYRAALTGARPGFRAASPPPGGWAAFGGYVASVAASADGREVVATSPHGHIVAAWRAADGRCLGATRLADAAPVAGAPGGWIAGTGTGTLVNGAGGRVRGRHEADLRFDNHWRCTAARPT